MTDWDDTQNMSTPGIPRIFAAPKLNESKDVDVDLCFSGGGVRSAAYMLGVLNALPDTVLSRLRVLSSVSGGGYTAGGFSAELADHVDQATDLVTGRVTVDRLTLIKRARKSYTTHMRNYHGHFLRLNGVCNGCADLTLLVLVFLSLILFGNLTRFCALLMPLGGTLFASMPMLHLPYCEPQYVDPANITLLASMCDPARLEEISHSRHLVIYGGQVDADDPFEFKHSHTHDHDEFGPNNGVLAKCNWIQCETSPPPDAQYFIQTLLLVGAGASILATFFASASTKWDRKKGFRFYRLSSVFRSGTVIYLIIVSPLALLWMKNNVKKFQDSTIDPNYTMLSVIALPLMMAGLHPLAWIFILVPYLLMDLISYLWYLDISNGIFFDIASDQPFLITLWIVIFLLVWFLDRYSGGVNSWMFRYLCWVMDYGFLKRKGRRLFSDVTRTLGKIQLNWICNATLNNYKADPANEEDFSPVEFTQDGLLLPHVAASGGVAGDLGNLQVRQAVSISGAAFTLSMGQVTSSAVLRFRSLLSLFSLTMGNLLPFPRKAPPSARWVKLAVSFLVPAFYITGAVLSTTQIGTEWAPMPIAFILIGFLILVIEDGLIVYNGQWAQNYVRNQSAYRWAETLHIPFVHRLPGSISVSDGGHYDNLGLSALLDRQATRIIVADAGFCSGPPYGNAIDRVMTRFRERGLSFDVINPSTGRLASKKITDRFDECLNNGTASSTSLLIRVTYPKTGEFAEAKQGYIVFLKMKPGTPLSYEHPIRSVPVETPEQWGPGKWAFPQIDTMVQFFTNTAFNGVLEHGKRDASLLLGTIDKYILPKDMDFTSPRGQKRAPKRTAVSQLPLKKKSADPTPGARHRLGMSSGGGGGGHKLKSSSGGGGGRKLTSSGGMRQRHRLEDSSYSLLMSSAGMREKHQRGTSHRRTK